MANDIFALAERRLTYLDQRQQVLAQNIANANTPKYLPQDLSAFSAKLDGLTAARQLTQTSPAHLPAPSSAGGPAALVTDRTEGRSVDGNGVALDTQLVRMADTETSQQLVAGLYTSYTGMMRTALGVNGATGG
jgi:flagellar basal-body rod protein FlgB